MKVIETGERLSYQRGQCKYSILAAPYCVPCIEPKHYVLDTLGENKR